MALTKEFVNGADYGIIGGQSTVAVVAVGDPAAAGYSGIQNMYMAPQAAAFGYPNSNAIIVAKYTNVPSINAADYYYKAGAEMFDGVIAPAVRYQFFDANAATMATNISVFGSNILWAALDVSVANPAFTAGAPVIISLKVSGGNITIPFTGLATDSASVYKLYGSPSPLGPYGLISGAVITGPTGNQFQAVTTAPPNTQYYYRIKRN
jgi:hypothetical protein